MFVIVLFFAIHNSVAETIDKDTQTGPRLIGPTTLQKLEQIFSTLFSINKPVDKDTNRKLKKRVSQAEIESELEYNSQISLRPGHSYSFILNAFSLIPDTIIGTTQKIITNDEFLLKYSDENFKDFSNLLLNQYLSTTISQEKMQLFIWSKIAQIPFDDFSKEHQELFIKEFPELFNNQQNNTQEESLSATISSVLVLPEKTIKNRTLKFHEEFFKYQNNIKYFSPPSQAQDINTQTQTFFDNFPIRSSAVFGWHQTSDNYFIRAKSFDEYRKIKIEIYVPSIGEQENSKDNVLKFRPQDWTLVSKFNHQIKLIPQLSNKPISRLVNCNDLKDWRPDSCVELNAEIRKSILQNADPTNYPTTRYSQSGRYLASIEERTDCSHFVHEIFGRTGLYYPYATSKSLECVSTFKEIPPEEVLPGDLVVFKKHVGIIGEDYRVISATKNRGRAMLSIKNKRFQSSITSSSIDAFGKYKILRWQCPNETI